MAKKVLVVDDEENIRLLVKGLLEDWGYEVSMAKDGKGCLAKLKKKKFNLVLMDFFMPLMSGREVVERIRKNPKLKNTKIAFLTVADFRVEGIEALERLKILDYITKPFSNEDLKKRIKKII